MVTTTLGLAQALAALGSVTDPEIPVLTIDDLGIVRHVEVDRGRATVTITPTYSGCPAMDVIRTDIVAALQQAGFREIDVRTVYAPAWTTDWMSEAGKQKLAEYGIAPPGRAETGSSVLGDVRCPRCREHADTVSEFGSTACKALMVCTGCGEPFDAFKAI